MKTTRDLLHDILCTAESVGELGENFDINQARACDAALTEIVGMIHDHMKECGKAVAE